MSVWKVLNWFTDLNFTLILLDGGYEVYRGPARDLKNAPEDDYQVIAIEPPRHAREVILHVDGTDYFEYDLDTEYDYDTTEA